MDFVVAFATHFISSSSSVEANATMGSKVPSVLSGHDLWYLGMVNVIFITSPGGSEGWPIDWKDVVGYKLRPHLKKKAWVEDATKISNL